MYVANGSNNTVSKISLIGAVTTVISTGLNGPDGLAFDNSGDLFIGNYSGGTISKLTPGGTFTTFATGVPAPDGMATDASGNVYVSAINDTVYKVAPDGTVSPFANTGGRPAGETFDDASNLFVTLDGEIEKVTSTGSASTFATGFNVARGLAFSPLDGDLYVANFSGDSISKVAPNGTVSTFATGLNGPYGLAFDKSGFLYAADYNDGTISKIALDGTVSLFASGLSGPQYLAFAPAAVPEASTTVSLGVMLGLGGLALGMRARRRSRA